MRKICIFTGSRAEYGLLRSVMQEIQAAETLQLQILAGGMHLSPEFGMTIQEIRADGFEPDETIEILLSSDTPIAICKSMGLISEVKTLCNVRNNVPKNAKNISG
jgi:UDP-N-acetylglucosamine 2-epimerase